MDANYTLEKNDEMKILIVNLTGTLTAEFAMGVVREVRKQAYEIGYTVLYDVTQATVTASLGEAYFFPRNVEMYEDPKHKEGKIAIQIDPGKLTEFWEFYVTTSKNAGYNIEMFESRNEAADWLNNGSDV